MVVLWSIYFIIIAVLMETKNNELLQRDGYQTQSTLNNRSIWFCTSIGEKKLIIILRIKERSQDPFFPFQAMLRCLNVKKFCMSATRIFRSPTCWSLSIIKLIRNILPFRPTQATSREFQISLQYSVRGLKCPVWATSNGSENHFDNSVSAQNYCCKLSATKFEFQTKGCVFRPIWNVITNDWLSYLNRRDAHHEGEGEGKSSISPPNFVETD